MTPLIHLLYLFWLPFLCLHCYCPFTTMNPTSPNNCHSLTFRCAYSCTKLHLGLISLVGYHTSFLISIKFPLSQPISKTQNIKGKIKKNKKKTIKTNNNMTPQTKWYGHTLDINKAPNQAQQFIKYQKH